MDPLRVSIISRSRIAREGMARLLQQENRLVVCSHHGSLERALPAIIRERPDVVVLQLDRMLPPESITAIKALRQDLAVVVSGVRLDETSIIPCARAGATSYLRDEATPAQCIEIIEAAVSGEIADSGIGGVLNRYVQNLGASPAVMTEKVRDDPSWRVSQKVTGSAARVGLTARERQILDLIDKGLTAKQIASRLDSSLATVRSHIRTILTKYNVHSQTAAAAQYRRSKSAGELDEISDDSREASN